MSFTNPAFLWAMFAVSIPVIIHLINFRRYKTIYFSNTLFLEDIKKETQTRTKLKHILILIARILTISMLVLAFAGPFIPNKIGINSSPNEINAIYVDNSFSMEAEGTKGQVFEQAKQIAKQIALNSPAGVEYLIITNDMLPEYQNLTGRDAFIKYIDQTNISSRSIVLNDIVLKANTLIPINRKSNLYIISDMQKSFLDEIDAVINNNTDIVFIPIKSVKQNNLYIDTCYFETPIHKLGQQENLKVKIVNNSDNEYFEIPIQLYINDSLKALSSFNIESGQSIEIDIEYVNTFGGDIRGRLEITDYPVTYDNYLYFNYSISSYTNTLIINSEIENRFLKALFESDTENFKLTQVKLGNEQSINFENFDIIILNNISEISTGLTSNLQNFVSNGGSLVFIPALDINYNSCNNFLNTFNAGKFDHGKLSNAKLYNIEYNHELLKNVFQRHEKQTELPMMGFTHKYTLFNSSTYSSILSLENTNPVLVAGNYKNGKVYILSSPLTEINSEFLKSTLFVPIFFNIALNSQINNPLYSTLKAGATMEIITDIDINESDIFRITNDTDIDAYVNFRLTGKTLIIQIPKEIEIAGDYKLIKDNIFISPISFNYDRKESDLTYLDTEGLEQYISTNLENKAKIINADSHNIAIELKEFSEGRQLWQLFLILALLFIICEVALARLLK